MKDRDLVRALTGAFSKALKGKEKPKVDGNARVYAATGYTDYTQPSPRTQINSFKGVFLFGVELRASAISDALAKNSYVERQVNQREFSPVPFNNPWYQILSNPNLQMDAWTFYNWMSMAIDLQGVANLFVRRNGLGVPVELLPIYREFGTVAPIPDAYGGVDGYAFYRNDGQILGVEAQDILQIGRPSPYSPYQFISLLEATLDDLEVNDSMKEYRKTSLESGGFSTPILSSPDSLSNTQIQEMANSYKQFTGKRGQRNNKVMVLQKNTKPVDMLSSRDLQFLEGQEQVDKSILLQLGLTEGLYSSATTRATAEAARYVFASNTIQPMVNRISGSLTKGFEKIFNSQRNVLYVRVEEVIPKNEDFELRQRESYLKTGQRTINDYLKEDGFKEAQAGDKRYVQSGLVPIDAPIPAPLAPVQTEAPQRSVRKFRMSTRNIQRRVEREKAFYERKINMEFQAWLRNLEVQIKQTARGQRSILEPFDENEAIQDLFTRLTPIIREALKNGYDNLEKITNIAVIPYSDQGTEARAAVQAILNNLSNTPKTLLDEVKKVIFDNAANREDIVSKVGSLLNGKEGSYRNISNSLATASYESGQRVSYAKNGITKKRWVTSRDEAVRETHIEADGQEREVSAAFNVGSAQLQYPADPDGEIGETIGCRCFTLPVIEN